MTSLYREPARISHRAAQFRFAKWMKRLCILRLGDIFVTFEGVFFEMPVRLVEEMTHDSN